MEEEDDPVVQEIPVFLSQALAEQLYIFQYPVKPANREWKESNIVNASVKPKNQMVRLEVGLDPYGDKYCGSKGEQIAINTDGFHDSGYYNKDKDKQKSLYFKSEFMDKIVYESSTPCTVSDRYAVAILQDKELHCTSVKGILQLRPSYSYYDKQDKKRKEAENVSEDEEEEAEVQQVTVKFARTETDVAKKLREKSYDFISKKLSEEPWHDALWKHSDTDHADLERLKLFSATTSSGSALSLRPSEYIRNLVPAPPEDEADSTPKEPGSLQDQIKELLVNAKVMSLAEIVSGLRGGVVSEGAVVAALASTGCCVRGCWTARSPSLYGERGRAGPVSCHVLAAARDHVLYLFTQHPYVDRRKISATTRLPPQEIHQILTSTAKYNPLTGWELLIPPDIAFEQKYPDIVQRQHMYLEARQRLFNEMMLSENQPKRQRKKSQRDSVSSDIMSPKQRCNSVSEEDGDKKRVKNKSVTGQGKRSRNVSSSSHDT